MKAKAAAGLLLGCVLAVIAAYGAGIAYLRTQIDTQLERTLRYLNGEEIVLSGEAGADLLLELRTALQHSQSRLSYRVLADWFAAVEAEVQVAAADHAYALPLRIIYSSPFRARLMIRPQPSLLGGGDIAQYEFFSQRLPQLESLAGDTLEITVALLYTLCPQILEAQVLIGADYQHISPEELQTLAVHDLHYSNHFQLAALYRLRAGRTTQLAAEIRNLITHDSLAGRFYFNSRQQGTGFFEDPGCVALGIEDYFDIDLIVKQAGLDMRGIMRGSRYFDIDYRLHGDLNIDQHLSDSPLRLSLSGRLGSLDLDYLNELRAERERGSGAPLLDTLLDPQLFKNQTAWLQVTQGQLEMSSNVLYGIFVEPGEEHDDQDLGNMLGTRVSAGFTLDVRSQDFRAGLWGSDLSLDLRYDLRAEHELVMRDLRSALSNAGFLQPQAVAPLRTQAGHIHYVGGRLELN